MSKKILLLSILYFLLTVLFPIVAIANFKPLYTYLFDKHDVYESFGNSIEAESNFDDVLGYISLRSPALSDNFFSREDILHMLDVRVLFVLVYFTIAVSTLISILVKASLEDRKKASIYSGISSISLVLFILLCSLIFSFDALFISFHKVFFRNDYWLLDFETSRLVRYFPQGVFETLSAIICILIVVVSIKLMLLHALWKRIKKK